MKKEVELYEVIYLLKPSLAQHELEKKTNFYQKFLTSCGSQVMVQNRGRRPLSYPIKNFQTATFIQMFYLGNGEVVKKFNREVGRDSDILRRITTKLNSKEMVAL